MSKATHRLLVILWRRLDLYENGRRSVKILELWNTMVAVSY
jgi:hypothetical protein